jgi:branched-chain amino acid aminotransferase
MMVVFNGEIVAEEQAMVSIFDRGLLYGDGLFETIRVFNGKPFRWGQHETRFRQGAEFLGITVPEPSERLRTFANELVARNRSPNALLRLLLTRGTGPRGYSPKGADRPTLAMSLHPAPDPARAVARWKLITSTVRLPANEPLANFKTCNKLAQIMARTCADDAGANEALLLNTDGHVVEGSSSNLFWIEAGAVCTPSLGAGVLPGVTRAVVMELCRAGGFRFREGRTKPEGLRSSEGVFLSLTSAGLAEASELDGHRLPSSPMVAKLHAAYWDLLNQECR